MKAGAWWQRGATVYRAILANAGSLVGATAVTSALGFVYWWVAARQFPPEVVGFASALLSAMALLGTLGMMGLGTLLIGELPRRKDDTASLLTTAALVAGAVGTALGVGFALVASWVSPDFQPLGANPVAVALFALGVALTAVTLVLDQALVGMMRGPMQLGRNFVFATVKLLLLVVFAASVLRTYTLAIYLTWVLGNLVSLVLLVSLGLRQGRPARFRPDRSLLRSFGRAALGHHALNLALQFANLALPLVVTATLSVTTNAYFYTAWMIAGFVFTLPFALTVVLYAVGAADPTALARKIRFTLGVAFLAGVGANAALFVVSGFVLQFFGTTYAAEAKAPLQILALGVFALIIKDHYVALCRIQSRVLVASGRIAAGGCLELAGAAAGAMTGGLTGLTVGWLAAVSVEALLMALPVVRVAMPGGLRNWQLPPGDTPPALPIANDAMPLNVGTAVGETDAAIAPMGHR